MRIEYTIFRRGKPAFQNKHYDYKNVSADRPLQPDPVSIARLDLRVADDAVAFYGDLSQVAFARPERIGVKLRDGQIVVRIDHTAFIFFFHMFSLRIRRARALYL